MDRDASITSVEWLRHVVCAALVVRTRHLFGAVRALLVACAPCAACMSDEVYSLCFMRQN